MSDPRGFFAQGVTVIKAGEGWMEELSGIISEYDAGALLVGMPRRTDGAEGPEAAGMRGTIDRIAARFPGLEVLPWDERFTTVIANQALLEADVSRSGRRERVDKVAASVLLQSYLDSLRTGTEATDAPPIPMEIPIHDDGRNNRNKRKRDKYN